MKIEELYADSNEEVGNEESGSIFDQTQPNNVEENEPTVSEEQLAMARLLAKRLGSDSIKINMGDKLLDKNLSELTPQQQLAALDYHYRKELSQKAEPLTPDATKFLEMIESENGRHELVNFLIDKGYGNPQTVSREEAYVWQLVNEGYSQEEAEEELEAIKSSKTFEKKSDRALEAYNQMLAEQRKNMNTWEREETPEQIQRKFEEYQETIVEHSEILGFEIADEEKQKAFSLLLPEKETGISKLDSLLNNPAEKAKIAMAIVNMGKIQNYVDTLLAEIEELKTLKSSSVRTLQKQAKSQNFSLKDIYE